MNGQSGTASKGPTCMLVFQVWGLNVLGLFCLEAMRFSFWLRIKGSESSFKESWHRMFRAWSKSDRVLSTWLLPLVQGVGVHRFIGSFYGLRFGLLCDLYWRLEPLSLEITFPKVPAKVLGWSTRSRCQGLFMKVMKVSWKSFQSKYFWRTYWVLMVLFTFVWFF